MDISESSRPNGRMRRYHWCGGMTDAQGRSPPYGAEFLSVNSLMVFGLKAVASCYGRHAAYGREPQNWASQCSGIGRLPATSSSRFAHIHLLPTRKFQRDPLESMKRC